MKKQRNNYALVEKYGLALISARIPEAVFLLMSGICKLKLRVTSKHTPRSETDSQAEAILGPILRAARINIEFWDDVKIIN